MVWRDLRRIGGSALVVLTVATAITPARAGDDERNAPFELRVMRDGTEVEIFGHFQEGLLARLGLLLLRNPKVKTVHLTSAGGAVAEAVAVGQLIRARHLDTYVAGECHSACTIAFAAGRRRWLDRIGHLGFHAPTRGRGRLWDWMAASPFATVAMSYRIAGFSEPFIARATTTPNAELWRPSLAELREAGVVTDVSDGSQFAWSGFGPNPAMRAFAEGVANVNVTFRSMRDNDPSGYDRFVRIFSDGYAAAKPRTEVLLEFWTAFGRMLEDKWPLADDPTMVALATQMADEYEALGRKDPANCYRNVKGEMSVAELQEAMPTEVWARHEAWQARMVATARPGAHRADDAAAARRRHASLVRKLGREKAALVDAESVPANRYAAYCDAVTAEYRAIAKLPASHAGPMMRAILQGTSGDMATGSTR